MRFKAIKWGPPASFIVGWHYGKNPASGQGFLCVGLGFINLDFEFKPYGLNEKYRDATAEEAAQDLFRAGPGGICNDCGHFAGRHIGNRCAWPERDCSCKGMLWHGRRITMNSVTGPEKKP